MDYITQITKFIKTQMSSKTKLHERDIIKEIVRLVKIENPGMDKSAMGRYADNIFSGYKSDNTEYNNIDSDMGYYIYLSPNDTAIFQNTYNSFLQRQKIRKDSKGRFIVVMDSFGKPYKMYGV